MSAAPALGAFGGFGADQPRALDRPGGFDRAEAVRPPVISARVSDGTGSTMTAAMLIGDSARNRANIRRCLKVRLRHIFVRQ
jgi:hypothetical protein